MDLEVEGVEAKGRRPKGEWSMEQTDWDCRASPVNIYML